jgi:hypothetical protein
MIEEEVSNKKNPKKPQKSISPAPLTSDEHQIINKTDELKAKLAASAQANKGKKIIASPVKEVAVAA